jgi:hypothetical protein
MTASEAFDRLQDADKIWQTISKGAKGSDLRAAWRAREAALRAYHAAVNAAVGA